MTEHIRFYTLTEVAEALGVSTRTLRRHIRRGTLRVHRIGRAVRVSARDLDGFLDQASRPPLESCGAPGNPLVPRRVRKRSPLHSAYIHC